jgi:glutathione S-transferase
MSPAGTVEAEVDLRVGGPLRIVMRDAGVEIEHQGEFVEVDTPQRLVFTWRSRFTAGDSLVTVTFAAESDATTNLVIVHSRLPEEAAESHEGGWGAMADRLGRALEAA